VILDTNALSAWAAGDKKLERLLAQQAFLAVPVVVLGEYRFGLSGSKLRSTLEPKLEELERLVRVLDITRSTARVYALIRAELKLAGTPIPSNDTWIAALAREHDLPIASRDTHFDSVAGVKRVEW
jgi:tRNA(fMet)-specific endonuclease VapC